MIDTVYGNMIALNFTANELTKQDYKYRLPEGYSVQQMKIVSLNNALIISTNMNLPVNTYVFPIVNGKSPSTIPINIIDISKPAFVRIAIEKFGGIPYDDYFKKHLNRFSLLERMARNIK